MKPKISLVTLGVRDFRRSFDFYRVLGFEVHQHEEGHEFAMFRMEGSWLGLYPRHLLAEDAKVSAEGSGFPGFTLAHNVGSPEEVDRVYAHALSCGAAAAKAPEKVFWGGYSGYFADPDGFLWGVAHNPFTDLT